MCGSKFDEGLVQVSKNSTKTPAAQYFSTDSRGIYSGHQRVWTGSFPTKYRLFMFLVESILL
ncbi:hypothetical protein DPMN_151299 [Dreissena polymorpha]|uniref:Uncharacterized protein n=1 Tax=Dreissena polymorpha TaxID=45954 RepID=A0A9D4FG72_DREPO|nr:hypothetical protein DPMN_151299 [Dreissena polymorpha]